MRRTDREVTDINVMRDILDRGKVMHMGMVESGKPYVLPLNYGYVLSEECLKFYFHSALAGKKMEILKENPRVFCEVAVELGLYGNDDDACSYGYYFASVAGSGRASILSDTISKKQGLDIIMKHQTGRDGFSYGSDLSRVAVIEVTIPSYTAKMNPIKKP